MPGYAEDISGTNSGKSAVVVSQPDSRPKTLGACGPRVFGLGCGIGSAFGKSLRRLQIFPRVSLSILTTTLGEIFPDNH